MIKNKVAFITGVTGQDGSYLAELLLKKNYIVHGLLRRTSTLNIERIQEIIDKYEKIGKLNLHYMDLTDTSSISNLIIKYKPHEFYNLAAMSHVGISFYTGEATLNINTLASYRILESLLKNHKKCKFYQASSSEMFGSTPPPQNEKSSFNPQSPYGISKVSAFHTTKYFRQAHGLFASNGILFNHESPRRGPTFVTKKIVQALVRIKLKKQQLLTLGNLYAIRDWGHAKDYVESMWKILQYKKPDDWVIATNEEMTVKEFINKCARKLNINLQWKFKGINEIAIDKDTKKIIIKIDKKFFRPGEVDYLKGDYSKAKKLLKWAPKYKSDDLIDDMIKYEKDLYE